MKRYVCVSEGEEEEEEGDGAIRGGGQLEEEEEEEETGREEILKEGSETGLRNPCISIPPGFYGSSVRRGWEGERLGGR